MIFGGGAAKRSPVSFLFFSCLSKNLSKHNMAFDLNKQYNILFDAFPLEYRFTGLGQFCYNLLSEYGVQAEQNMEFSAFLRKEWIPNLEGLSVKIHKAGWIQRHHQDWMAGFFFGKYDLWHISEELARFVSAPKKTKVALTIHGL